jgi:hypothetical protein
MGFFIATNLDMCCYILPGCTALQQYTLHTILRQNSLPGSHTARVSRRQRRPAPLRFKYIIVVNYSI